MESITLINGDCLDILRSMPSESVDAVVTDPPFGIGFLYGQEKEKNDNPTDYWYWLKPRVEESLRCLKPGGFVAIWQTQKYFRHFWDWYGEQIHIYAACKNFVQIRHTPINYAYDPVVMWYKGGYPLSPERPPRNVDFFVANTAPSRASSRAIERNHPCPRPLDQVMQIVHNFTLPGGIILDPFLGSGTTAVACVETGRKCMGIELNPDYFAIAQSRLQNVQPSLLAA